MVKVYQNTHPFNLSTSVRLENGRIHLIDFTGYSSGRGTTSARAEFSTDSDVLQAAIERDSRYGDQIICVNGNDTTEVEKRTAPQAELVNTVSAPSANNDNQTIEVLGITNTQAAIEWLGLNKEYKFSSSRPAKAEVQAVATSFNVVFTDWN